MKVSVLETRCFFLFLKLWCVGNFRVHNLNHKDSRFRGCTAPRAPKTWDCLLPLAKLLFKGCLWTRRVFCSWRLKNKSGESKKGKLGFLGMILENYSKSYFYSFPTWTLFLAHIRWFSASLFPLMLFPAWHPGHGKDTKMALPISLWNHLWSSRPGWAPSSSLWPFPALIQFPFTLITSSTWNLSYTI